LFFYPVAASFITLISISLLLISHYSRTTYRAARGEISQFHFPDSSVLILNADSKVSFRKYGWDKKRIVSLEGEAFFDVRKGRDFYIETSEATVKVLGTTFNVYSRDGFFSVKCKTGEILVISKIYESADTLKNKEAVDIDIDKHKGIKKYLIADNNAASWINGEFNYNDAPLAEVLKEFERQFNLKVSASAIIQSRHYSGYFRNDSLIQALEYICTPMNLNYQISKGNIIHIY
jgi:ferric-dicitrate binding protein FerR (iron transport regulator)